MKIEDKCEFVTVDAGENLKKLRARNFVRPTKHSVLLPYFDELDKELDHNLQQILNGLFTTFATENPFEGAEYCENMRMYLNHFGLRMSKETFLNLIRFFYEVLCRENLHSDLVRCGGAVLQTMLRLAEPLFLGYRDLTLDWRPLYDVYKKSVHRKIEPCPFETLNAVTYQLAAFFHPKEHAAIWEACLQYYSQGSQVATTLFTTIAWSFLSIRGLTEEEVKQYVLDVWLKKLWDMYLDAEMNTAWTLVVVDFISDLVMCVPGAMDLRPYFDTIYTKLMRGFLLTVRDGKILVGDGQENSSVTRLANFVAHTIGGPHSSLSHFQRFMQYISFNVHPQNSGAHDVTIDEFMISLMIAFQGRIQKERLSYRKRAVPKEYYLTDEDIDAVTEALVESAIMMMYSPDNFTSCYKVIYALNSLNRELVAPKILDHLYTSISAISEPQRLSILISSFSTIIFETIRSPTPEYRAPRNITYDSHWLKVMEEERKLWPTYELGSELPQVATHRFTSLRAHAFYIMEILVNHINVNDVDRTASVLKTLVILFSSFPLMDFSSAIQYHGAEMSEDDKMICLLSKRVPRLVQFAFTKILDMITCFSVCPLKVSSSTAGASMSSESQQCEGSDETTLKNGIQKCTLTIFERVDDKIRDDLYNMLFDYLKTAEFATFMPSDLLTTVITAAVWRSGIAFQRLAKLVLGRLKTLLTDDVRKLQYAPSTVIFNAILSHAAFTIPHNIILENEQVICEIADLLLSTKCKMINRVATHGINTLLYTILNLNTESTESPENLTFAKPLREWNPIKEWARCNDYTETVIKWYIPAKPQTDFAQRIANRYLFPVIEQLQPKKLDREHLRRALEHLAAFFSGIYVFDRPDAGPPIPDVFTPYCLPIPRYDLGNTCTIDFVLKGPNGENTEDMLVSMAERMIGSTQDPVALNNLNLILSYCHGKIPATDTVPELERSLDRAHQVLRDATYEHIWKASQHTMDELAFYKHSAVFFYHKNQVYQPTAYDQRVLRLMTELALNDYETVRDFAQSRLMINIDHLCRCRNMILPQVCAVLTDQKSKNTDRLAGAMQFLSEIGWTNSVNPKFRLVLWDAILRIRVHDDFNICNLFESISQTIGSIDKDPVVRQETPEESNERSRKIVGAGSRLIKTTDVWAPFLTEESIKKQTAAWQEFEQSRQPLRVQLVDMLFERHINNKDLHHTRENLARSMAYGAQRELSDERTIKLMLSQVLDENYTLRKEARIWLCHWLKKNKPKSVRVDISPVRTSNANSMECGIRDDNMWTVYDSLNLPDTEEKWNEMMFCEKDKGACRWASKVSVVRKRKDGPPLETKPLTAADRAIIEFFSNEENVRRFFAYRVIEKEDHPKIYENIYGTVKYIVRNYPEYPRPLELFTAHLMSLMECKFKNEQNMAAELFIGIVTGLKHHPFTVLESFWKEITERLDKLFTIIADEAALQWSTVIILVLTITDLRRLWWLVESLLECAKRSSMSTEFQHAFRLCHLQFPKWRYGEIAKKVSVIAMGKLNQTLTDSLRIAIARSFLSATRARAMNNATALDNIPSRFIPNTVDEIIDMLVAKIPQLKIEEAQGSVSNPVVGTPKQRVSRSSSSKTDSPTSPAAKRMKRSQSSEVPMSAGCSSTSPSDERTSMACFRTLLEYIKQYYETAIHSYTPSMIRIIPKLMEYANEDDLVLTEETYRNTDITKNAAMIIHEYMSGAWLNEKHVEEIMKSLQTTYKNNGAVQRVRNAVVKFIQACVYSNMYIMNHETRREQVKRLLFDAVIDPAIEVRREASKCLLLLIHCDCIHLTDAQIDSLAYDLDYDVRNPGAKTGYLLEARLHGSTLLLGALVLAFPFSLPIDKILKPLRILNSKIARRHIVRNSVTETMREFRRQHRDDWQKTKIALGEELAFDIENAIAPAYYA